MVTEKFQPIAVECDFQDHVADREKNQVGDNMVTVVTVNGCFLCVGVDLAQAKRNAQERIEEIFSDALASIGLSKYLGDEEE